jgi:transglutaminase-like putative cysteine protease
VRHDRLAAPLAALATALTTWSLAPVVEGSSWQGPALAMILVVLLAGLAARALGLPRSVVLAGQVGVGVVTLTAVFARHQAIAGLFPGPAALDRYGRLLLEGGEAINRYTAPVPASRGLSLILALGVFGIAILVDHLTVVLRAPAAAGLPLLALYCVPAAVLPNGLTGGYFVAAATGWLLLLAHDAGRQVLRWGRLLPRWGSAEPSLATFGNDAASQAAAGRRLAVAAVALAVLVPAIAPGVSDGLLTRGSASPIGGSGGLTVVNPVLTLRDNLNPRRDVEVLRYRTDQQDVAPLRIVTADVFDGASWQPGIGDVSGDNRVDQGLPPAPGLLPGTSQAGHQMHVEVGNVLDQDFLPLPYPTLRVRIDGAWLYDATSLNVVGDGETVRGKTYDVNYLAVRPSAQQLRDAPAPPSAETARYTQLPRNLPYSVRKTAAAVTAGTTNPYDRALALQEWFRASGRFTYSTDAPGESGGDAVAGFLRDRRGFCVQFSSAMAVMARTLGIPARIGVGFLPGTPLPGSWRSVRLTDSHAWPELYFRGAGWVRFEPTPAVRTGAAPPYARPTSGRDGATPGPTSTARPSAGPTAPDGRVQALQRNEAAGQASGRVFSPLGRRGPTISRTTLVWAALALLVVLTVLLGPVTAWSGRRRRRRSAADPLEEVEASWADLRELVGDLGIRLDAGATPRQLDARLTAAVGLADEPRAALGRITTAVERSRYAHPGAGTPTSLDPDLVRVDVRRTVRAVRSIQPRSTRARAVAWPASGWSRIFGALDSMTRRFGGWDLRTAARLRARFHLRARSGGDSSGD